MTVYGLLIVDTSWANQDSIEIDKTAFLRYQEQLIDGTRALIYVRDPIDAIVAEAEITGSIIETETAPPDPYFNPSIPANVHLESELNEIHSQTDPPAAISGSQTMAHTYRVPLKLVRLKGQSPQIPLNRLQMILGSSFSAFDESWIPLDKADYQAITAQWSKEKAQ